MLPGVSFVLDLQIRKNWLFKTITGSVNGTVNLISDENILYEPFRSSLYTYHDIDRRFNIGRKAVYGRIKKIKIKGFKRD